jgi:hypothetical protein
LVCSVLAVLAWPFKPKRRLEAENAALRHQLNVRRRKVRDRPTYELRQLSPPFKRSVHIGDGVR